MTPAKVAVLLALLGINNALWIFPVPIVGYYFLMFMGFLYFLKSDSRQNVGNMPMMALFGAIFLSIVFNDIPARFQPWQRLVLFGMITAVIGPWFSSRVLAQARIVMMWIQQIAGIGVTVSSFFLGLIGIATYNGGYFGGLTGHSVLMGLIAANSTVMMGYVAIRREKIVPMKWRKYMWLACLISLLIVMRTGSRSAFLAAFFGTALEVAMYCKARVSASQFSRGCVIALFAFIVTSPVLSRFSSAIVNKNKGSIARIDITSRTSLWQSSLDTFYRNPFAGIGFCAMDVSDDILGEVGSAHGQIEPGSSWLAVLSMTGIVGGIAIFALLATSVGFLREQWYRSVERTSLLWGLLTCDCLHMCSEGYIFAAGGYGFFNFWLLLGAISAYGKLDYEGVPSIPPITGGRWWGRVGRLLNNLEA